MAPRSWFVSGCSTGIGRLLCQRILAEGECVVATARNVDTLADLGSDAEDRILRLPLDVTDEAAIAAATQRAKERFGAIDVLVNNAGFGYFSTQEEAELSVVRKMYETNVFGLIALTQAWLPAMRERGSGTIVNISSMAGHMGTPRGGFYQSTKWAVEALSESLSMEMAPLGIRIVAVEPGRFETHFSTSAQLGPREEDASSPYVALRERWREGGMRLFPEAYDPAEIIDATWDAVQGGDLFQRVPVGKDSIAIIARRNELGDRAFVDWMREQLQ